MAQAAGAPSVTVPEEPPPLPHSSSSSSSSGDSGHVSQSHSSASGIGDEHAATGDASRGEFLLAAAAADYASYLLPSPLENVASAGQASEWTGGGRFKPGASSCVFFVPLSPHSLVLQDGGPEGIPPGHSGRHAGAAVCSGGNGFHQQWFDFVANCFKSQASQSKGRREVASRNRRPSRVAAACSPTPPVDCTEFIRRSGLPPLALAVLLRLRMLYFVLLFFADRDFGQES